MSFSKLREMVRVREAWHAAVHGDAELDMTEWVTATIFEDLDSSVLAVSKEEGNH